MIPRPGRYFWKLFLLNAALMALLLSGCLWVIIREVDRSNESQLTDYLRSVASALTISVRDHFDIENRQRLDRLAKDLGSDMVAGTRITFVLESGLVLGDSIADPATMDLHNTRPEIIEALAHGTGHSKRWSHTLGRFMNYVAVRIGDAAKPLGVVRVSMAVRGFTARSEPAQKLIMTIALVSIFTAILLALALAALWSRRVRRITQAAFSLARGDLSARVNIMGNDEVALLGHSLNRMRERISGQLDTIDLQRRTLESLLSQLREGVVVGDVNGRIVLINREARRLLKLVSAGEEASYTGVAIEHCIPQRRLQDLLRVSKPDDSGNVDGSSATANGTDEIELQVGTGAEVQSLLARAFDVRLPDATRRGGPRGTPSHTGRVLVLTDVTELTKIMKVKADLASNASHELRTPLSAIRAVIDTLRTIDTAENPASTADFIKVLDRHCTRMEAMIADLLDLSRIESGKHRFDRESISATKLLEGLRTAFNESLTSRELKLDTSIDDKELTFSANPELLRMTLRNLLENAIRFSANGSTITVAVTKSDTSVTISVADHGCGIAPEHQRRVFERFYQVQKSGTDHNRGTGLGLSIVRHAVAAMDANVKLDSELGVGTTVTITLPQSPPAR